MLLPYFEEATFQCPAEPHTIPKAVHVARMESGYHKCRECEHATGFRDGHVHKNGVTYQRSGLNYATGGIRGVVGFDWTAETIRETISSAIQLEHRNSRSSQNNRRISVVIGSDGRTSSLQLAGPILEHLQLSGCHTTDVGIVMKPVLSFATTHLNATLGVYITGSGCTFSHSGIDIVDSRGHEWNHLDLATPQPQNTTISSKRISRNAGETRVFDVGIPYHGSFHKHFHALRPLRLYGQCFNATMSNTLQQLFQRLPCTITTDIIPEEFETDGSNHKPEDADLAFRISEDGTSIRFHDENSHIVPGDKTTKLIRTLLAKEYPNPLVLTPEEMSTNAEVAVGWFELQERALLDEPVLVSDNVSRWWFPHTSQGPDAVLSLAYVLQVLSQSDKPFSQHVAELSD